MPKTQQLHQEVSAYIKMMGVTMTEQERAGLLDVIETWWDTNHDSV